MHQVAWCWLIHLITNFRVDGHWLIWLRFLLWALGTIQRKKNGAPSVAINHHHLVPGAASLCVFFEFQMDIDPSVNLNDSIVWPFLWVCLKKELYIYIYPIMLHPRARWPILNEENHDKPLDFLFFSPPFSEKPRFYPPVNIRTYFQDPPFIELFGGLLDPQDPQYLCARTRCSFRFPDITRRWLSPHLSSGVIELGRKIPKLNGGFSGLFSSARGFSSKPCLIPRG